MPPHFDMEGHTFCLRASPLRDPDQRYVPQNPSYGDQECSMAEMSHIGIVSTGGTAKVRKALFRDRIPVALKIFKESLDPVRFADFRNEECAMAHLYHPNAPQFYCTISTPTEVIIVMELIAGHDGIDWLALYRQMSGALWMDALIELAHLLNMLHEAGMIYRDLKLENLVIERSGRVRLVDFGYVTPKDQVTGIAGTLPFLPPEVVEAAVVERPCVASPAIDWYGLGLVMAMLYMGEPLIDMELPDSVVLQTVLLGFDRADFPRGPVGHLLYQLVLRDPSARWGYEGILDWVSRNPWWEDDKRDEVRLPGERKPIRRHEARRLVPDPPQLGAANVTTLVADAPSGRNTSWVGA